MALLWEPSNTVKIIFWTFIFKSVGSVLSSLLKVAKPILSLTTHILLQFWAVTHQLRYTNLD